MQSYLSLIAWNWVIALLKVLSKMHFSFPLIHQNNMVIHTLFCQSFVYHFSCSVLQNNLYNWTKGYLQAWVHSMVASLNEKFFPVSLQKAVIVVSSYATEEATCSAGMPELRHQRFCCSFPCPEGLLKSSHFHPFLVTNQHSVYSLL